MTWLQTLSSLAALLEQRAEHWICFLQRESEPLVRHPHAIDHSLPHHECTPRLSRNGDRIRCVFAANPSLVQKEPVPQRFFERAESLETSLSIFLIPYYSQAGAAHAQTSDCLQWEFTDYIELKSASEDDYPQVRVGGNLLPDLSSFEDIRRLCRFCEIPAEEDVGLHDGLKDWIPSESSASLRDMIDHMQNSMRLGDYYLANASTRLWGPARSSFNISLQMFVNEWLSAPVRNAVYVSCGDELPLVCCFSPERFVQRQGALIQTEPIKGTAPFMSTSRDFGAEQLWNSEKEMSEQTLVTDLLRNDLNAVCRAGSVRVTSPYEIHRNQSLLQMQSVVEGELMNPRLSHASLLNELLPAGSVTGTPKWVVSQEICAKEASPRGYYTGVFACALSPQELDSTVLIRGFFADQSRWLAGLGAGVTTLSDPDAEVQELQLKWRSFAMRWQRMSPTVVSNSPQGGRADD